jgi:hypothetical protein
LLVHGAAVHGLPYSAEPVPRTSGGRDRKGPQPLWGYAHAGANCSTPIRLGLWPIHLPRGRRSRDCEAGARR